MTDIETETGEIPAEPAGWGGKREGAGGWNRKPREVEHYVLDLVEQDMPILHITRHMAERADELGEEWRVNRDTIYKILRRYGIDKGAERKADEMQKASRMMVRNVMRYVNGVTDKDTILAQLSEYEGKWL